jgi:hypothetical protein
MTELMKVEQCIAETNSRIECQRRLIETLGYEGHDVSSAQIVFDSLCITLSLHLQHRYRLHRSMHTKAARSKTPDLISKRTKRGGVSVPGARPGARNSAALPGQGGSATQNQNAAVV